MCITGYGQIHCVKLCKPQICLFSISQRTGGTKNEKKITKFELDQWIVDKYTFE
jgi:hypothetical protein